MRFQKDFEDASVIRLERNYRSTANILNAASVLISHNKERLGKTLRVAENSPSTKYADDKIKVFNYFSGEEEAKQIALEIEKLHQKGFNYADIAVLVRTAAQTREFEEKFISEAIPYQVIGGPKFYERAEIRDILAYLRVLLQSDDDLAFERIINKPARGIGAKTIEKLRHITHEKHVSMYGAVEYLLNEATGISGKAKNNLSELMSNFKTWRELLNHADAADLTNQIINDSGYMDMLKNDTSAEAEGRVENLRELINVMSDTDNYPTLQEFMEHVSLVMDNDSSIDTNKVMLITLHSAKGLEFNVVFLPGWEESLFPHQRSLDEGGENSLEEERRLAYVAITRAKQKLYISMATSRRIYGEWKNNTPSRFLNEIPSSCLQITNQISNCYNGKGSYYHTSAQYGNYNNYKPKFSTKPSYRKYDDNQDHDYSYEPVDNYYSSPKKSYKGTKVYHESFGYGRIISISGSTCLVDFDNYGEKKVMSSYLQRV